MQLLGALLPALALSTVWEPSANLPAGSTPAADPSSLVRCDAHTRFSVLGERLVRAEYSLSGVFEDRATLAAIHRAPWPPGADGPRGRG